jgi:hypothetical protein
LIKPWDSVVQNPSIFSVLPSKPILHTEALPSIEGLCIYTQAPLKVIGVDTIRPAVSKLGVKGLASELEPWLVKVSAQFVRIRHPNQHGSGIGDQAKKLLALAYRVFSALAVGGVS